MFIDIYAHIFGVAPLPLGGSMREINNFDELVSFMWQVSNDEASLDDAIFHEGCASIPIRVEGVTWDKRIDARGARYVQELQNELNAFFKKYNSLFNEDAPLVKVAVREGSGILDPDFWPILKEAIKKMPPKLTFTLLMTFMACSTGYAVYSRYESAQEQSREHKVAVEAVRALKEVALQNGFEAARATKPIRSFVRSLESEDRISVAGSGVVTGDEAKKALEQKRTRSQEVSIPCDGRYVLEKLDVTHSIPVLELSQDGVPVNAYLEHLASDTKEALIKTLKDRLEIRKEPAMLELQIDVHTTSKRVKYGSVVGTGAPREAMNHRRLKDLPLKPAPQAKLGS